MKEMPRVAIVYLTFNATAYLEAVAESIGAQTYPRDRLLFLIVDNVSGDETCERIRSEILPRAGEDLPEVLFLPQEKNEGWAAGCNVGIREALARGYEYVYLLNNDAKLDPHAIEEVVKDAESDATIGAVQSLLLLWKDPERVNATGGAIHVAGFGYVRDNGKKVSDMQDAFPREIAYTSGAASLYRARVFQELGFFESFFFMYHDDLEFGMRLQLAGWKNVLCPSSIAYHDYAFHRSMKKFFWMERNRLLVLFSYFRRKTLLFLFPLLMLVEIGLWFTAILGGWGREKLRVVFSLCTPASWKFVRAKRRELSGIRRITDRELLRLWTGVIADQPTISPLVRLLGNPVGKFYVAFLRYVLRS